VLGELYRPGVRLCGHKDCVNTAHIEKPKVTPLTDIELILLSAEFTEWLMGLPEGWITAEDIGIKRNDQLKACGNGVVPQQAEMALRILLQGDDTQELFGQYMRKDNVDG
jgi:hypothetical protein